MVFSFFSALVLTTYHLEQNDPCCMYKSIQKHCNDTNDKIILTNNDVPSHNFILFSFFFFFNFQIHSTTGKNCLQQNSFRTSTQWLNMTIFFFLQLQHRKLNVHAKLHPIKKHSFQSLHLKTRSFLTQRQDDNQLHPLQGELPA